MCIGIIGSHIHEFIIIILCFLQISRLYGQFRQLIEEMLPDRRPFKGQKEFILRLVILSVLFIYRGGHGKEIDVPHPGPVDSIGYLHRRAVVSLVHPLFDLVYLYIEFILIHLSVSPEDTFSTSRSCRQGLSPESPHPYFLCLRPRELPRLSWSPLYQGPESVSASVYTWPWSLPQGRHWSR